MVGIGIGTGLQTVPLTHVGRNDAHTSAWQVRPTRKQANSDAPRILFARSLARFRASESRRKLDGMEGRHDVA